MKSNLLPPLKELVIATGAIFILALCAYSNSFEADFHYDDYHQIVKNEHIRELSNIPSFFQEGSSATYLTANEGYRPLLYSSFALNYRFGLYDVRGYHIFNFLLHALNSVLVFLLAGAVFRAAGRRRSFAPSLAAALVFALHPIQTGAVTYISGRSVLLASLFCLSSFFLFMLYRSGEKGIRQTILASLAVLLFLGGLLSKEMAVSLPALFLLYDLLFVLPGRDRAGRIKAFLFYIPVAATAVLYLLARGRILGYATVAAGPVSTHGYLLSESKVFLLYLRLLLLPFNQNADYNLPITRSASALVVLSALLIITFVILLLKVRRKNPAATFFGLWFLIALAPESSIFPILDTAVEYRLYLPSVGFIAAFLSFFPDTIMHKKAASGLAIALLAMFGVLSFNRNAVWASEESLWRDVTAKSPWSSRAHNNLGIALAKQNKYVEAEKEFRLCIATDSRMINADVYSNLGLLYQKMGMDGLAIENFKKAIWADPGEIEAAEDLGGLYIASGRYAEAVEVLETAVQKNPGYTWTHYNLALAYEKLGRKKDALKEMQAASQCSPNEIKPPPFLKERCAPKNFNKRGHEPSAHY